MRLDAAGRLIEIRAPNTVSCTACDSRAERLSSAYQTKGLAYHHYRCRDDDCPAGGTVIKHENGDRRRFGPVFRPPRTHCPTHRPDHPASVTREPEHQPDRESTKKSLEVNA